MREYTDLALDVARSAGAQFADVRLVEERRNRILVQRRALKLIDEAETFGYAVRVLVNGAWGFASSTRLTRDDVARAAARAVATARASATVPKSRPARMTPAQAAVETRVGPCAEDPFAVPNAEKAQILLDACSTMMSAPNVVHTLGWLSFTRLHRVIANTDGSYLDLTNTFAEPMLMCTAVVDGESQSRQYQGGGRQAGFEWIRQADFPGHARAWAEEAVMKCRADSPPLGQMDLVLDPTHLALTLHESVAHPTELDRILGWEANYAGRSFVRVEDVGQLRYGSQHVNFTVDNALEGGLGSWFFDDDGVRLHKFPVIRDGVLVGLSCTRETAAEVGWPASNGCCRADSFEHFPINRNPNIYMEPGPDGVSPDDLIAGVEKGVYIEGQGSFSIDQMRRNFQFGGDMFWMIEGGKKTRLLKKVTYQAQTTEFWGSCDGVAGSDWWASNGVPNCGKGEPPQIMRMTHGASHARFRNIRVGDGSQ